MVKRRQDAPPGFFESEAAGLRWLADAAGGVPAARVLRVWDGGIELEHLPSAAPTRRFAEELGRRLASTHAAGADAYGCPPAGWQGPGFIGPLPMDYGASARWGEFYARLRLEPYARRAHAVGALTASGLAAVNDVCDRLVAGRFDDGRPPARLHGDLWSGNVLWTPAGAALIDPSAHGGSAETDLAMLALFGLPHLEAVLGAYDEAAPLPDGWRERVGLHQLYPLLVHAALFAGGYGARAEQVARRYT